MKTLFKTKMALLVVVAGLAFSCKKNDAATTDQYADSTAVETVDTTAVSTDTVGTGATGVDGTTGVSGSNGSAGSATDTTTTKGR
ncbi:hypothetical protein [Flavobacterium sp.]|uniref:hypothetical protein n=1 Tax=Flavobacterium sp. TaxID=239 RepID=UPI00374D56B8